MMPINFIPPVMMLTAITRFSCFLVTCYFPSYYLPQQQFTVHKTLNLRPTNKGWVCVTHRSMLSHFLATYIS